MFELIKKIFKKVKNRLPDLNMLSLCAYFHKKGTEYGRFPSKCIPDPLNISFNKLEGESFDIKERRKALLQDYNRKILTTKFKDHLR